MVGLVCGPLLCRLFRGQEGYEIEGDLVGMRTAPECSLFPAVIVRRPATFLHGSQLKHVALDASMSRPPVEVAEDLDRYQIT